MKPGKRRDFALADCFADVRIRGIVCVAAFGLGATLAVAPNAARADEGGVSFWPPGTFGSLAAVPGAPGWSLGTFYYHVSADASASQTFHRGGNIVAGLRTRADLVFFAPTYTFAEPIAGAQAALGLMGGGGTCASPPMQR